MVYNLLDSAKEVDYLREGEGLVLRERELKAIDPSLLGVLLRFSNRFVKLLDVLRLPFELDCFKLLLFRGDTKLLIALE